MSQSKSVFAYTDYREFLRDFYEYQKVHSKDFSYAIFAKLAGFKSRSVLKNVIEGRRSIAPKFIESYIKALKLDEKEGEFFRKLVELDQSENPQQKEKIAEAILKNRLFRRIHPLGEYQYNFWSHWYYGVVWEMTTLATFQEDPKWISEKLGKDVSVPDVKRAINELVSLNLLVRNEQGRLVKTSDNVGKLDAVFSPIFVAWHKQQIKKASESIDSIPRELREIFSITFAVSQSEVKKLKEKMSFFRERVTLITQR